MKRVLGCLCVVVVSLSAVGCNSGGSCTYKTLCGADVPPTADETTLCDNKLNDPCCGGLYSDYLGCMQSHQSCTSSGLTDDNASNAACNDKLAKYENCYFGTVEGGTCRN
jgi:hypothetical protein